MGKNICGDKMKNNKFLTAVCGVTIGFVNGLLGAGGGMLTVPLLKKCGLSQRQAHENAIAVILPITAVSAGIYLYKDYVNLSNSFAYLPTGFIGAIAATFLMKKISNKWLNRIFAVFMLYAGIRLLVK